MAGYIYSLYSPYSLLAELQTNNCGKKGLSKPLNSKFTNNKIKSYSPKKFLKRFSMANVGTSFSGTFTNLIDKFVF